MRKGGKRKKTTHGASEGREMCAELQTQLKLDVKMHQKQLAVTVKACDHGLISSHSFISPQLHWSEATAGRLSTSSSAFPSEAAASVPFLLSDLNV